MHLTAPRARRHLSDNNSAVAEPCGSMPFQFEERNVHGTGRSGHPPVTQLGRKTINALTFKPDHSVGAGQSRWCSL